MCWVRHFGAPHNFGKYSIRFGKNVYSVVDYTELDQYIHIFCERWWNFFLSENVLILTFLLMGIFEAYEIWVNSSLLCWKVNGKCLSYPNSDCLGWSPEPLTRCSFKFLYNFMGNWLVDSEILLHNWRWDCIIFFLYHH